MAFTPETEKWITDRKCKPRPHKIEEWLAVRKCEALLIDPATAEIERVYGQTLDPYNVDPDLPEELQQIGREYFASRPGSEIWVHFGDLPDDVREKLWERAPVLRIWLRTDDGRPFDEA